MQALFTTGGRLGVAVLLFLLVTIIKILPKVKEVLAGTPERRMLLVTALSLVDGLIVWNLGAPIEEVLGHLGGTFVAASGIHQNISSGSKIVANLVARRRAAQSWRRVELEEDREIGSAKTPASLAPPPKPKS